MRISYLALALVATTTLLGCHSDKSGGKPDLTGSNADFSGSQDLAKPASDLAGNTDDLTANLDDLSAVDLALADLTPPPDQQPAADMTAPPVCGTMGAENVLSMTVRNLVFSEDGTNTFKLPLGFKMTGTATLTDGDSVPSTSKDFQLTFVNQFTGDTYGAQFDTPLVDVGTDLSYAYSIIVPAGQYAISSKFVFFKTGSGGSAQLTATQTEATPFTVCPLTAAEVPGPDITHIAVPELAARSVFVTGLAAAYKTKTVDPTPVADARAFFGSLYLQSTNGRLTFLKDDSGYTVLVDQDSLTFDNWFLPKDGFVVQPSFAPELFATPGWAGTFRFDSTLTLDSPVTNKSLAIAAADLVTLSGTVTDTHGRLFKSWAADADGSYLYQAINCDQIVSAGDKFVRPTNNSNFDSNNLSFTVPLKKNASCDFSGDLQVRLPLADNQGTLAPPASIEDGSISDLFILTSTHKTESAAADTVETIDVPNLSGDVLRTIIIQNAAGDVLQNYSVVADTPSLTDFPTYAGESDSASTTAAGQVQLHLLKGTYHLSISAP